MPWLSIGLVALAGLTVLASRSFLFYEGSENYLFPAEYGVWTPTYNNALRAAWVLMQVPLLIARGLTDDVNVLSLAYGAPYALVPSLAVLFVVLALRTRPYAGVAALIGMCLVPLPWQLFAVTPWAMINHFSWMLAACVARRHDARVFRVLIPVLAALAFFSHPLSFVPLAAIGIALLVARWLESPSGGAWRLTPLPLAFVLVAALRAALMFVSGRETRRVNDLMWVTRFELTDAFRHAGAAFFALYLVFLLGSAAALLLDRPRRAWLSAGIQAAAALSLWAYVLVDPRPWLHSIDYHWWTFAVLAPFFVIFGALAFTRASGAPPGSGLAVASILPPLIFLVVLGSGSYAFRAEMTRLHAAVEASAEACVEVTDLPGEFADYPLYAFVFSNNYLATTWSRRPDKVLLDGLPCYEACWAPSPGEHHLFDFGTLPSSSLTGGSCATTMNELIR